MAVAVGMSRLPPFRRTTSRLSDQTSDTRQSVVWSGMESTSASIGRLPNLATNFGRNRITQYLVMSNVMRSYMESLPEKLTLREEICSFQFWKSLRTEFLASFLFIIFGSGSLVTAKSSTTSDVINATTIQETSFVSINELTELKLALAFGLTVACLVQFTGHVSGCHLSPAITIGFFVGGRVTPVRLVGYLVMQCLGSIFGCVVLYTLFGTVIPVQPAPGLMPSKIFGIEFFATFLVVLTFLANCDAHRIDLGFKSLSIGLAYTVGHLFAFPNTGASLSPARALAASLITGTWCLHWIYWVSSFVAGLIGGLTYEYIGSIKPNPSQVGCGCACHMPRSATAELRQQFTEKIPESSSGRGSITSPISHNTSATTAIIISQQEPFSVTETEFTMGTEHEHHHLTRY